MVCNQDFSPFANGVNFKVIIMKNHNGNSIITDWKRTRSRLEGDWKQTRSRLEADWKRTGSGLEADWKRTGSRLETDRKKALNHHKMSL